jgi:HAMP domain-containing protein
VADDPIAFHPQIIPAYAATQIFDALRKRRPEYSYREATLNPTNPRDRALEWEADVVRHFRNNQNALELVRDRNGELGQALYLAQPIRIDDARCLACHDAPGAAPAAVLHQYGSVNGFGWKLHETVGAQIVSVPLESAMSRVDRAVSLVVGAVTVSFVVMFVIVNLIVRTLVLKPIARLSAAAESISTGSKAQPPLKVSGRDEISNLCRSFERMRTSIDKSMAMLARHG